MAEIAYLKLKGQRQGDINGSVTTRGHEGSILTIAAQHGITVPRDPASGLPTGRRMHKAFVITKPLDRSSPLLYNALVQNENLVEWELQLLSTPPSLPSKPIYEVRLSNAMISDIEFSFASSASPVPAFEMISFTYHRIEWIWTDGDIEASDTWQSTAG